MTSPAKFPIEINFDELARGRLIRNGSVKMKEKSAQREVEAKKFVVRPACIHPKISSTSTETSSLDQSIFLSEKSDSAPNCRDHNQNKTHSQDSDSKTYQIPYGILYQEETVFNSCDQDTWLRRKFEELRMRRAKKVASPSSEVEEEAPERQHLLPSTPQDILDNLPDLEDPPEEGSSELERRVSFQPPSGPSPSHSAFEIDHHRRRSSDLNSQESSRQESMMSVVDRRRSTLTRLSAVRMVATTSKTKHRVFMTLNFCLILLGTLGVVLTIKDMSNSKMGFRDLRNAKKEFFDVGHYPMGGMGMLMAGGCLDGISMFIFLCGYFCECQYYRHYMRFVFVNLLLAITATIVLFLTQENADHYLQRYFEYGATAHPEPLGNFIDSVQDGAKCCGFETPQDWRKTAWWENGNVGKLPSTCCDVKPIPISGSKETSHLIPLCTFKFKNVHPLGCRNLIFPIKGSFRIYAKFVGIIKTLFLIAVVVLCSMLYKDTWYMKQSEAIRDESSLVQNGCEPMRQNLYKSGILEPNEVSYGRVSEPPSTVSTPLGSRKAIRPVTEHENFDQRVGHRLMLYNTEFSPTDPRIAPV